MQIPSLIFLLHPKALRFIFIAHQERPAYASPATERENVTVLRIRASVLIRCAELVVPNKICRKTTALLLWAVLLFTGFWCVKKNTHMKNSNPQANALAPNNPRPVVEIIPDYAVSHHGTVSLFHPLTGQADDWLRLHCPQDGEHLYFGNALAIEHRFVADIVQLATDDGLLPATHNQGRN